jgi:hypothetical protein
LNQVFEALHPARIAARLFLLLEALHVTPRRISRVIERQTLLEVLFNFPLQVVLQFVVEVLLDLAATKERPQP